MMDFNDSDIAKAARDQAAHWFARARLGTLTPQERRECEAWRAASAENDSQYRSLETLWRVADELPRDRMRAVLTQTEALRPPIDQRRRFAMGLGAACAMALVAGVVGPQWWAPAPEYTARLASAKGERKQFVLPDGSTLELNTDTHATVAFYPGKRTVTLAAGEILFAVDADPSRPFIVAAGKAQVSVTGTRFNVRRDGDDVSLAVESGSVEFSAGSWWNRKVERLAAGYVAHYQTGQGLEPAHPGDVAILTAWQRGRLIFRDSPLSQVVNELNRYLSQPLRIADAHLGRLRIAGTLGIDEPESALEVLPEIAPVTVLRRTDGSTVITAR
ncbi:FecR family protein [Pollutimonas bauzanensis]|uniref:FecR family protein n=1 Tax=Pollutimonas bauzanensis TaxID=658167 RepID=A0A1M5Z6H1_9BURK|nr:FecR family protein [Pollutimonas bauzanensis]SHI19842.1 FecR family protein [Pollutimonas bauzanensis]